MFLTRKREERVLQRSVVQMLISDDSCDCHTHLKSSYVSKELMLLRIITLMSLCECL